MSQSLPVPTLPAEDVEPLSSPVPFRETLAEQRRNLLSYLFRIVSFSWTWAPFHSDPRDGFSVNRKDTHALFLLQKFL